MTPLVSASPQASGHHDVAVNVQLQRNIVSSLPLYNYTSNSVLLSADPVLRDRIGFTPGRPIAGVAITGDRTLSHDSVSREGYLCPLSLSQPLLRCPEAAQGYI